ncbi:MAG: hypothetical protein WCL39_13920, partial [Armatimonadota bacterium]
MARIVSIKTDIVEIPQKVTFTTTQGSTSVSRAIVCSIKSDNGQIGLGEGTPVHYVTGETEQTVLRDLAAANEQLKGFEVDRWRGTCRHVREILP